MTPEGPDTHNPMQSEFTPPLRARCKYRLGLTTSSFYSSPSKLNEPGMSSGGQEECNCLIVLFELYHLVIIPKASISHSNQNPASFSSLRPLANLQKRKQVFDKY